MTGMATTEVDRVLAEHWDDLVDPVTTTDRLLELLDLPAPTGVIPDSLDTCAKAVAT